MVSPQPTSRPEAAVRQIERASWLFTDRVDYRLAVGGGIAAWPVAALAIFLAPRYL
ncbi:hypothetical protein [Mesorhizobium sp. M0488]|uniref:hypothetical protein n=1 Tax=unclassified Mesorhizobium TaxID=325217 RepID=UPI003335CC54